MLEDDLKTLCEKLTQGEDVSKLKFIDESKDSEESLKPKIKINSKKIESKNDESKNVNEFYQFEQEQMEEDENAKRAATYEVRTRK